VIMLGGLHTEMASLKTAGDWLQGSGWTQALVLAEIATAGKAESFLQAAHVGWTHQVCTSSDCCYSAHFAMQSIQQLHL